MRTPDDLAEGYNNYAIHVALRRIILGPTQTMCAELRTSRPPNLPHRTIARLLSLHHGKLITFHTTSVPFHYKFLNTPIQTYNLSTDDDVKSSPEKKVSQAS
jgi:hypothetical protein